MSPTSNATSVLARRSWLGWAAVGGLLATVATWIASGLDHGPPHWAARTLIVVTAFAGLAWMAIRALTAWRSSDATGRRVALAVAALTVLAFTLLGVGLDHEAGTRYFGDEGIYLANAERMNTDGRFLRPWFIYPHLLFELDAIALWVTSLFPGITSAAAGLWGVESPLAVKVLVTRWVTAGLAATTVLPVFGIGRRIAGDAAGLVGAAAIATCPLWIGIGQLNISDVPSAVFATWCVFEVAGLLRRERLAGYARAGFWAGLAAGSKYPAGLVVVAIVAIWCRWRLTTRTFAWGLPLAGLVSLGTFVLSTPSLLAFPSAVVGGEGSPDLLFGVRQYAGSSWIGVVRDSNLAYYSRQLARSFGWPLVGLSLIGLVGLSPEQRRRGAWITAYPAAALFLLMNLQMAVPRNILPVLPTVAALLGVGAAGAWAWAETTRAKRASLATALGLALALPLWSTIEVVVPRSRPTTRDEARSWIHQNVPAGAFFVHEAYTPRLGPRYPARRPRFLARIPLEELRQSRYDFAMVASDTYGRFLARADGDSLDQERAERYRTIFDDFSPVLEVTPSRWQLGPTVRIFEIDPDPVPWREAHRWTRDDVTTLPGEPNTTWSLLKGFFEPGEYVIEAETAPAGAAWTVRVVTRRGDEIAVKNRSDPTARFDLQKRSKLFVYVDVETPAELVDLTARVVGPDPPED